MSDKQEQKSALAVMLGLIHLVKPLLWVMIAAVIMGCIGNLMAAFIVILGGAGIGTVLGFFPELSLKWIFVLLAVFASLRGVLRYGEQASNHYIAFRLLARIRNQVFTALRRLAPARLDGKKKGELISVITSDIELLEVFYAHTISPIAIGVITSLIMAVFIGSFHIGLGLLAAAAYLAAGAVIPVINSRLGQRYGQKYRHIYGRLNTTVLDNLYGLDEILQYGQQQERQDKMAGFTEQLKQVNSTLKNLEAVQKISTDAVVLASGIIMTAACGMLSYQGSISSGEGILCIISMMSSFGPVAALSALSNNLNQTLASGNRVLHILEEEPVTEDLHTGASLPYGDIVMDGVDFIYPNEESFSQNREQKYGQNYGSTLVGHDGFHTGRRLVLKEFSLNMSRNTIHGILGKSGSGKSTVLKLLMRFYETQGGSVLYGEKNVNDIKTEKLRDSVAYVTQDTFLFQDTIENNIKVAKADATREEVVEAAKKASIHDFIMSLPGGYDTRLAELGESVSGGERQRIGVARAFLHKAEIILLDEPTSNIDSLNENIILKSLLEARKDKTIILVSHRKSTMAIAEQVICM